MKHPLVRVLVVAVAYAALGRLALVMAIPPGYATAVWPAAGVALVGAIHYGWPALAGVVIGSFAVNVLTATAAGPEALAVPFSVAVGATVQAGVGAALVRRFVGPAVFLHDEREIVRFLLLGGPVSCLVNAAIGPLSLWATGLVPSDHLFFQMWTWWVGDTIGVLIFAPLLVLALHDSVAASRRRLLVIGSVALAGFSVVTAIFVRASAWERERLEAGFEEAAEAVATAIRARVAEQQADVESIASFIQTYGPVDAAAFRSFVGPALERHPGSRAVSWAPLVRNGEVDTFLARASIAPAFSGITELAPDRTRVAASQRDRYAPVLYIEPIAGNEAAVGFDLLSEVSRRAALDRAETLRVTAATAPLRLVQDSGTQLGFLFAAPVFNGRSLRGWATAAFRAGDLFSAALVGMPVSGLALRVTDLGDDGTETVLHSDAAAPTNAESTVRRFPVAGRTWQLSVWSTVSEPARSWQAWFVLAGGLFSVGLLEAVLLLVTGRAARVEILLAALQRTHDELEIRVAERTAALQAREAEILEARTSLEARVAERTEDLAAREEDLKVLLRELHHRVKNSLQLITSLLSLQSRTLPDPVARAAFTDAHARVLSIAGVHEKLHRSSDVARIEFGAYLKELVWRLVYAHGATAKGVNADLQLEDVQLPIDTAIPCALIVNELVTNSLKHAFPAPRGGMVTVRLSTVAGGDIVELVVADDGIGLPQNIDPSSQGTLGMLLLHTLARQLQAEWSIRRADGTEFHLRFEVKR